jgi:nucleotide-binding universal stress UspA family protein
MTGREIVVGIDGSPSADAAIRWAADYARSTGSTLRAIHVIKLPDQRDMYAYPVVAAYFYSDTSHLDDRYRVPSTRVFEKVHPEPGWNLQFAQGHPGRILVSESKKAQALVLGAREHRGLERLLVGSVGHYCLSHALCPVVSVPAPGLERDDDRADEKADEPVDANAG